jgi:hypothetical protein
MTAAFIAILALALATTLGIAVLGIWCYYLHTSRTALQQKLSVVESAQADLGPLLAQAIDRLNRIEREQKEKLTQDQIDYRDKLQAQYAVLFKQIQDNMENDLKNARAETGDLVKKSRADFEAKLKSEFEKACEQIKFNEIEYKRTITKKRKEYSRKNAKNAKPQRVWRYIDEE